MKRTKIVMIILLIMGLFTGCSNLKSEHVDLSDLTVDNIKIGSDINKIDFSKYTKSNKYSGDYRYKFDELLINTNKDKISFIFTRLDEKGTEFKINSKGNIKTISDVTNILGADFKDVSQDKEQSLRKRTYYDKINNIKADFIYFDLDQSICGVEIYYA